jgi:hypothetical protein
VCHLHLPLVSALSTTIRLFGQSSSDIIQYHQNSSPGFHLGIVILDPSPISRYSELSTKRDSQFIFLESQSFVESFSRIISNLNMCHGSIDCLPRWCDRKGSSGVCLGFGGDRGRRDGRVDSALKGIVDHCSSQAERAVRCENTSYQDSAPCPWSRWNLRKGENDESGAGDVF